MKAVIMAGGEGSRLKPLTCTIPKPMARLCGRPIMEYILDLLDEHGFDEARVTIRYLPQRITEHFGGNRYKGVFLRFAEETVPLGTAGGVKNAAGDITEDFLVISGDAVCDFNLRKAVEFHRQNGADATIIVKKVEDPREYGLVNVNPETGAVAGFVEKPGYAQAVCDLANTGVYILSPKALKQVPEGIPFDFAKDLFPHMLQNGGKVLAYEEQGYWCDVGDLDSLRRCARDILEGKVRCTLHAGEVEGVFYKNLYEAGRFDVLPPAYIGEGVTAGKGCRIGSGSILDDGVTLGDRTVISASIIGQNAVIGDDVRIKGGVLCEGAVAENGARLFEGCAVGARAVIGSRATLEPGVKVWPMKYVKSDTVLTEHLRAGAIKRELFDDEGILLESPGELTPALCARLGAAIGTVMKGVNVGVASEGGAAEALKDALTAGLRQTGCTAWDFGTCIEPQAVFCCTHCGVRMGIYITAGSIKTFSGDGLTLPRDTERDIELCMLRAESKSLPYAQYGKRIAMTDVGLLYALHLSSYSPGLKGMSASVESHGAGVKRQLCGVLNRLGCMIVRSGEVRLELSGDGRTLTASAQDVRVDDGRILAILAKQEFLQGRNIAVRFDAPQIIDQLAEEYGKQALRYLACPADNSDKTARTLAKMQPWVRDALARAVMLMEILHTSKRSLKELNDEIPQFYDTSKTILLQKNPCEVMRLVSGGRVTEGAIGEGVLLPYHNGTVLVRPLKRGGGVKIIAEAQNYEISKELCGSFEKLLNKL
ncbi:sugar phosphate nucleotidyltransferase [Acetanaerobacterium elongatum]|uniref:Mannose-1-phosphate guanylyltransferase / phosphomannomutase n=1 Tax=Acetanaerobacterium elongatum TaxID=258515 RepID=A0A1H0BQJ3_9FIRM|nr:sugar phosphate nucleotidyltransferase [Acetanaerobacterium elongatum]SDN47793.1 mannose-1-phosphate guanylyltransferase / phosphomannomutase [Acetanaerobacterium elongatum]